MLVTFAGLESTVKSERLRARNRQDAERGLPHRNGIPLFGYDRDMQIVPAEASLIVEAADRVLAGESINAVASEFAERGVVGHRRRPMTGTTLREVLRSRTLAGERTYHGEVVAVGAWEPILDPLKAAQIRHAFGGGNKGGRHRRPTTPLLAGLLRCGRCEHPLVGRARLDVYACPEDGCGGGVGITMMQTDYWARETILWRLEQRWPANQRTPTLSDDQSQEIITTLDWAADATKTINTARFIDGTLSHHEYVQLRTELETRTGRRLHSTSSYIPPSQLPADFHPRSARRSWAQVSVIGQRAIVELEINHIIVHPSATHARWTPDRLEPDYWQPLPKRSEGKTPAFDLPPAHRSHLTGNPNLEPHQLRYLYLTEQISIYEIAKRSGADRGTVALRLREMGIPTRAGEMRREIRQDPDLAETKRLYLDEGHDLAAVAELLGVGTERVKRTLEDNRVPIRPHSQREREVVVLRDMYADPLVNETLERHKVAHRPWTGAIYERFPAPVHPEQELISDLFVGVGCSCRQIELLTGNPDGSILRWLRSWGISTHRLGPSPLTRRMRMTGANVHGG